MTRADIANKIATATGLSKVETETVVEGFILCVIDALKQAESIEIKDLVHSKSRSANRGLHAIPRQAQKLSWARDLFQCSRYQRSLKKQLMTA